MTPFGKVGEGRNFDSGFPQLLCDMALGMRGDSVTLWSAFTGICGGNQQEFSPCITLDEFACCTEWCGCFILSSLVNIPVSLLD